MQDRDAGFYAANSFKMIKYIHEKPLVDTKLVNINQAKYGTYLIS